MSAPTPAPRSALKWVYVDLDQTLAEGIWSPSNPTRRIGPPIERNVRKLREVVEAGYKIIIHTSRGWTDYETIESWLNHHGIPFKAIQCGKPLGVLYVDDRGRHESALSWLPEDDQSESFITSKLRDENAKLRELIILVSKGPYFSWMPALDRIHALRKELGLEL